MSTLDEIVTAIQESGKYTTIEPALIRTIAAHELAVRRNGKAAIKETKARLHQIAGAYFERTPKYARLLADLQAAEPAQRRDLAQTMLLLHASTRERAGFIAAFYQEIFAQLPPVNRLLDLACGMNPLAAPWMPLPAHAQYMACDIYADLMAFVGEALPLLGIEGQAQLCDLTSGPPDWPADVALILKTLPVLEQVRRGAGRDLLRAVAAPLLVVSFPTRSLSGRNVGMHGQYTRQMDALCAEEQWHASALEFPNELVFIVRK